MAFDYKKEYKEFYMPKNRPALVEVPAMNYVAVRGKGDPNEEDGDYKKAMNILYGIAFTIKMSYKGSHKIDGYFEYVVPPLEGFWWMEDEGGGNAPDGTSGVMHGVDYEHKDKFCWISCIRLPEFVTKEEFDWAVAEATAKKKTDFSAAEFLTVEEGLCVQMMHVGPYDDEPASVALMDAFLEEQGYETDFESGRLHHEIYLSDARRTAPEKLKTVIRHPVRKK